MIVIKIEEFPTILQINLLLSKLHSSCQHFIFSIQGFGFCLLIKNEKPKFSKDTFRREITFESKIKGETSFSFFNIRL